MLVCIFLYIIYVLFSVQIYCGVMLVSLIIIIFMYICGFVSVFFSHSCRLACSKYFYLEINISLSLNLAADVFVFLSHSQWWEINGNFSSCTELRHTKVRNTTSAIVALPKPNSTYSNMIASGFFYLSLLFASFANKNAGKTKRTSEKKCVK